MIIEKIQEQALKEVEPKEERYWFRASESGDCSRAIAYSRLGIPGEEIDGRQAMLFKDGHLHHDELRRLLSLAKGVKLTLVEGEKEKRLTYKGVSFIVRGHVDGIVNDDTVLEVKSCSHFIFKKLQRNPEPSPKYKAQANTYMWLFGKEAAIFLYKNKNDSALLEIPMAYDKGAMNSVAKKFYLIEKALKEKKLPNRDFSFGSRECYWCPFQEKCWAGEKKLVIEAPKDHLKVGELEEDEEEGKKLIKLAKLYEENRDYINETEEAQEKIKKQIKAILKDLKLDGARVKNYKIGTTIVEQNRPDNSVVAQLIANGTIPTKKTSYVKLDVRDLSEDNDD